VAARFGLASVRDVAVAMHRGELGEAELITLSAVLFPVAAGGDEVARSLVSRQAAEVQLMAVAAIGRLGMDPAGVTVVLGGGVLEARDPLLLGEIGRKLAEAAPGAVARVLDVPPVAGAALLGLDHLAATAAAGQRLREQYRSGLDRPP
jgi:N-acetylglucosamine kinase-like BadF-type ATPase